MYTCTEYLCECKRVLVCVCVFVHPPPPPPLRMCFHSQVTNSSIRSVCIRFVFLSGKNGTGRKRTHPWIIKQWQTAAVVYSATNHRDTNRNPYWPIETRKQTNLAPDHESNIRAYYLLQVHHHHHAKWLKWFALQCDICIFQTHRILEHGSNTLIDIETWLQTLSSRNLLVIEVFGKVTLSPRVHYLELSYVRNVFRIKIDIQMGTDIEIEFQVENFQICGLFRKIASFRNFASVHVIHVKVVIVCTFRADAPDKKKKRQTKKEQNDMNSSLHATMRAHASEGDGGVENGKTRIFS